MKTVLLHLFLSLTVVSAQIYETNNVTVQTIAGSAFNGYLDGQGQATMLSSPSEIIADTLGMLFFWDGGNSRIRRIDANYNVATFAGGGSGSLPGFGTNISLSNYALYQMQVGVSNVIVSLAFYLPGQQKYLLKIEPNGLVSRSLITNASSTSGCCFDSKGQMYFCSATRISRITTNGQQEIWVGSGNSGTIDGNGIFTSFSSPSFLACDVLDNVYVYDSGRIRRINQNRDVVTVCTTGSTSDGATPHFDGPSSMFFVGNDLIFGNSACLRRLTVITNATTIAGSFSLSGYTNGIGSAARFSAGGWCYSGGSFYVADSGNNRIRQISFNPSQQAVAAASLSVATFAGITINGLVGRNYRIDSSLDATNWSVETTVILNHTPYQWSDPAPLNTHKFYRAFLLP